MSAFVVLLLPTFSEPRGSLTVLQSALPFSVARSYWIYNADGYTRGGHRHRNTRQALLALHGRVSIYLNDGTHSATILLAEPRQCLIVEPEDWHTMSFGQNSVLLVMASLPYDPSEYIDEPYS